MKPCRICGETKPLDDFHPRASSADGHRHECKACRAESSRAYAAANAERLAAYRKAKYERRREQVIEDRRRFRAEQSQRINARRRAQRDANPERFRAVQRASYARNRAAIRERVKKRDFRRRTVKIEFLVERDGLVCGICGGLLFPEKADIDHIVPRALGGSNAIDNLQLAHIYCNRSKNLRVSAA